MRFLYHSRSVGRGAFRRASGDDGPLTIDKEFLEIPFDLTNVC